MCLECTMYMLVDTFCVPRLTHSSKDTAYVCLCLLCLTRYCFEEIYLKLRSSPGSNSRTKSNTYGTGHSTKSEITQTQTRFAYTVIQQITSHFLFCWFQFENSTHYNAKTISKQIINKTAIFQTFNMEIDNTWSTW